MSLTFACQFVQWSTKLGLCIYLLVYSLFMYSDCCTQISHPPAIDIQCRWVKLLSRIFQLKIAWHQCLPTSSHPSVMNRWTRILCLGWNLWRDIQSTVPIGCIQCSTHPPSSPGPVRSFNTHISCSSLTTIRPSFYSYIQMDYNMPSRFSNFLSSATPSYRVKAYSALLVLLSVVRLLNHHHPFLRPSMNIFIGYAWTNVVVVDVGIYFMSGDVHTSMANGVCMWRQQPTTPLLDSSILPLIDSLLCTTDDEKDVESE